MADLLSPQFSLPFRVAGKTVVQHEQDSDQDVEQNVEVILRYEIGQRPLLPKFGIPDQTFLKGGADLKSIMSAVREWEPNATVEMVQSIASKDGIANVDITITNTGGDVNG